jgi:hypothetical protein
LRDRGLRFKELLDQIFGDTIVIGRYTQTPSQTAEAQSEDLPEHGQDIRDTSLDLRLALTSAAQSSEPESHSQLSTGEKRRGYGTQQLAKRRRVTPAQLSEDDMIESAQLLKDGMVQLARSMSRLQWQEKAHDIFWNEFRDERVDLQLKFIEILEDEKKALFFYKMPADARKAWVAKFDT